MMTVRSTMLASAFAVGVGAAGATVSGGAPETARLADACARQVWPAITQDCLTGDVNQSVRLIQVDSFAVRQMRDRFEIAFD